MFNIGEKIEINKIQIKKSSKTYNFYFCPETNDDKGNLVDIYIQKVNNPYIHHCGSFPQEYIEMFIESKNDYSNKYIESYEFCSKFYEYSYTSYLKIKRLDGKHKNRNTI